MINVVTKINKKESKPPKTKTFKRDNFKEKRSSKVSSFKTTNLYLSVSFCLNFPFLFLGSKNVCFANDNAKIDNLFFIKIHFINVFPNLCT